MRLLAKNFFWVVLLAALFLMPPGVAAQKKTEAPPPAEIKKEKPPEKKPSAVPKLSELIIQATKLSNRLAVLQTQTAPEVDVNALEKKLQEVEARLAPYPAEIEQLKASPTINFTKLVSYKDTLRLNAAELADITAPLTRAIDNLGEARKQWFVERQRWQQWQSVVLKGESLDEMKTSFASVQDTIDLALLLITQRLQPLVALLQKSGSIEGDINRLIAELDGLTQARRRALLTDETVPLFSWTYLAQLKNLTWLEVERGMQAMSWPKPEYFKSQGWILVLQLVTALAVMIIIFRYRQQLMESKHWRFLATRPIAAGISLGILPFFPLMAALPTFIFLLYAMVGGPALVRLLDGIWEEFWQRLLLGALIVFLILTRFFYFINLPEPLLRLYIFIAATVGLGLCVWRALVSPREDSPRTTWLFRLGCVFFLVVLAGELGRYPIFAEYLLTSGLRMVAWIIVGWFGIYVARGLVEGLLHSALLQEVTLVRENTQVFIRRGVRLVKFFISGIVLAQILMAWQVYDNPLAAIQGVLSWGVTLGSQKITVGLFLTALACLYGAFLLSWFFQVLLMEDKTAEERLGPGGQQSVATLIHYTLVFVGFLVALAVLGIDLTKVTIMLGALGVGIGFGLQTVVNNFVSGITLLIERPIRRGDYIQLPSGDWAEVKRIGLRATRVLTFDYADIWIPNAELISHPVINWTYSNRFARLRLPVGVAYGTDTAKVLDILMEVANEDPAVGQYPAPYAFFNGFGPSSLNFELRVYLVDSGIWFTVYGRLYQKIEQKLREAGIVIPFPQQDLHLRSVAPEFVDRGAAAPAIVPQAVAVANPPQEEPIGKQVKTEEPSSEQVKTNEPDGEQVKTEDSEQAPST
jgi:small-conductance mechanosensitive channel